MNKVELEGRAGKDAEVRYTQNGKQITTFSLATSNDYKPKGSDEWVKRPADWHNIVVFGDNEEAASVRKGDKVKVSGKITYRKWEGKDGIERTTTEIIGWEVISEGKREAYASRDDRPLPDDDIPF